MQPSPMDRVDPGLCERGSDEPAYERYYYGAYQKNGSGAKSQG